MLSGLGEDFGELAGSTLPPLTTATRSAIGRQFGAVKEQCSGCNGSAGLGNETRGSDDGAHGGADFGFGDGDDAVDEGLDVGEVALARRIACAGRRRWCGWLAQPAR